MSINIKNIEPGNGLGELVFGMSREDVVNLLGEPTEKEKYSYSEEEDDLTESWHYDELDLSMSFDEEFDYCLSTISVSSNEYNLGGKELFGLEQEKLVAELNTLNINDLEVEDWSSDENPEHKSIASESLGVIFWFDQGELSEIQWGPVESEGDFIDMPSMN